MAVDDAISFAYWKESEQNNLLLFSQKPVLLSFEILYRSNTSVPPTVCARILSQSALTKLGLDGLSAVV